VSRDILNRYLYARKKGNYRPLKSYVHVCEALSLTYTIRMHLHFYVTYAIIALHYLMESQRQRRLKTHSDTYLRK